MTVGNVGNVGSGIPGVDITMRLIGSQKVISGLNSTSAALDKVAASATRAQNSMRQQTTSYNKVSEAAATYKLSAADNRHTQKEMEAQTRKTVRAQKEQAGMWKTTNPLINKANNVMNSIRWTMVNVGFALMALAAIASPFVLLTKQGMEYEQQLREIAAVSGEIYQTQQGLGALAGAVAGVALGRPATFAEAASAMLEYQRAGFSLTDAMRDVPSVIDLSVAGFTDLTKATQIVTAVLHQFGDQGVTAAHAADVIAKAAVSSATTVEEFGNALSYVGAIAAGVGISFEETAAALGLLSNAGLRGSRAGTALRQVLSKISRVSKEGEASMKRLGLSFFDTSGQVKSLQEIFSQLDAVMTHMTDQEKQTFISEMFEVRSRAGVVALLRVIEESAFAIEDFASVLSDSGFAARTAADIQQASAMKMKTAWGNFLIGLQPLSTSFNNMFSYMINTVEEFSSRFMTAVRRDGFVVGATKEMPLTLQILGLTAAIKIGLPLYARATKALNAMAMSMAMPSWGVMATKGVSAFAPTIQRATLAMGHGIIVTPKLTKAYLAQTIVIRKLSASKGFLAKTTMVVGKAFRAFYAFLGPVGWAILAIGTAVSLAVKHFRNLSRETEEQTRILNSYDTSIQMLATQEQAYTDQALHNSARRVQATRLEMEEQEKQFSKETQRLNRAIRNKEKEGFKDSALSVAFPARGMVRLPGQFISKINEIQALGFTQAMFGGKEENVALMKDMIKEKEEAISEELYRQNQEHQKGLELQERAGILLRGYLRELVEGTDEFQKFNNAELQKIIQSHEHYDRVLEYMAEIDALQEKTKAGIELSELEQNKLNTLNREYNNLLLEILDEHDDIKDSLREQLEITLRTTNAYRSQLEIINNMFDSIGDVVDALVRARTPEFNKMFSEFGDDKKIFGHLGEVDNLINQITEAIKNMTEAGDIDSKDFLDMTSALNILTDKKDEYEDLTQQLKEVETSYYRVNKAIEQVNARIKIHTDEISRLNEELSVVEDKITKITNMRFRGETDLDKLIFSLSQDVKRAELASWGIGDVYQFIQDAVGGVEGAFDGVLTAMREVDDAAKSSENQFKRWRTTVQEHIRALIIEGNDLATSTTDAVLAHANLLSSVQKFDDSSKSGKSDEELKLDALKAAQDYYYGGMHEQIALAIQAQEDLAGVHRGTAEAVISSLQREWRNRDRIEKKIRDEERAIDDLRAQQILEYENLTAAEKARAEYVITIDEIIEKITGENGIIEALNLEIQKYKDLADAIHLANSARGGKPFGFVGPMPLTDGLGQRMSPASARPIFGDFIMRPNSTPVGFSEDDTIIGARNPSDLFGSGDINITVNSNTNNPKELARQLAVEIKREMRMR